MKKLLPLLLFMIFGPLYLMAQNMDIPENPLELGVRIGTSHFLGDLGGQKGIGKPFLRDTDLKSLRPVIGIFGRWNIGRYFSLRLNLNYLQVAGDDKLSGNNKDYSPQVLAPDDAWFRWYRNLNFRSRIIEASIMAEIVPYTFKLNKMNDLLPYGFVGAGLFNFKPQGSYNGRWINLQPLATEGQGFVEGRAPYKLTQLCLPMGLGIKWRMKGSWMVALEVNHRLTFTDYIDDVSTNYIDPQLFWDNMPIDQAAIAAAMARRSIEIDPSLIRGHISSPGQQRGDPKDNDSYYSINITLSRYIVPHWVE